MEKTTRKKAAIPRKRDKNYIRDAQITAIKKRLYAAFDLSQMTYYAMVEKLNKECGYELNYETFRKTFDFSKNSLDIFCVMAMCKCLNLDIAYIFSEPTENDDKIESDDLYVSSKFRELNDEKYFGTFYGYLYSSKKMNDFLDSFVMEIKREGEKTVAILKVTYNTVNPGGEKTTGTKTLWGTPVWVEPSVVNITFKENSGTYYIFSFNYVEYRKRELYYRCGAVLTQGRSSDRVPMVQSFVLLTDEARAEYMDLIKGLLLMNDDTFHIPKKALDELAKKEKKVAALRDNLKYIFDYCCQEYYVIDENQILNSLRNTMPPKDAAEALILMKSRATDANRILFPENEYYSEVAKDFTKKDCE